MCIYLIAHCPSGEGKDLCGLGKVSSSDNCVLFPSGVGRLRILDFIVFIIQLILVAVFT